MRRFPITVSALAAVAVSASVCATGGIAPGATASASAPAPAAVVEYTSGWSHAEELTSGLVKPAPGAAYSVSDLLDGKAIRWNPCEAIHWRFTSHGAPKGGLKVVKRAVAKVARATGTRWVFDGTTTAVPTSSYLPTSADNVKPVLIGLGNGRNSDLLAGKPAGVLGVARNAWFGVRRDGVSTAAVKAGVIVLDNTDTLRKYRAHSWTTVLQHELAHLMGLDHATSRAQLMYPQLSRTLKGYSAGDLAGLRAVGAGGGCIAF
jgi:hypothetical protein